jgi:NADH-quinone oxidoreductase subunit J
MHSCIFLLFCLFGVAGLYASMGAEFLAVTQIIVYIGGIVVLMLFAIMLTGGKEYVSKLHAVLNLSPLMGSPSTYIKGGLVGVIIFAALSFFFYHLIKVLPLKEQVVSDYKAIGMSLLTDNILAFELSSVLLLGALIGAAMIARPSKDKSY